MFRRLLWLLCGLLALMLLCPASLAEELPEPIRPEPVPFDASVSYPTLPWDALLSPIEPHQDGFLPDKMGYHDDSLDIRITTFRRHDTTVMAVYVTLRDVSQFRTGTSAGRPPWDTTSTVPQMAKRYHAVLAINGDYFGYHNEGIVCRNGTVLRCRPTSYRDELLVHRNGDLSVLLSPTQEDWDAVAPDVLHSFCFGPALVVDGALNEQACDTTMNLGKSKPTQRMAIGQIGPLQYLFVATEGPENPGSVGFSLEQLAQLMLDMGCSVAYNLDGGSSSTVVLNYQKINALSTGKCRPVSDCIWFATLVP